MNNSQTYEKIVKVKNKGKRLAANISVVMCYLIFFLFWLVGALQNADRFVLIITAGLLSTALLVIPSWKYLFLEYEYSFWYGRMGVSKIYGKRKRRSVIDTDIKDLLIIAPATDEYIARAERFDIESRVIAVSHEDADNIWLTVTGGKDERRILIFFEADERSLAMLRSANPLSFVKNNVSL